MKRLFVLAISIVLGSCGPSDTLSEKERTLISAEVGKRLRDPFSAQYEWKKRPEPFSSWYCGRVNAKNGFGGYVGWHDFIVAVEWERQEISNVRLMELQSESSVPLSVGNLCYQ